LIRENRRLLILIFVSVVLLGPSFTLGYISGHSSAAVSPRPPAPQPPAIFAQPPSTPPVVAQPVKPMPGQVYLQVIAAPEVESTAMIQSLRKNGFPAITTKVPEKPELYRVLVGPLPEKGLDETRTGLQLKGFPADSAIKRTF
jgi:cell division septation protein DedD